MNVTSPLHKLRLGANRPETGGVCNCLGLIVHGASCLTFILATSLDGQVSVVDGRSGLNLAGWPVTLPRKLLFAAPLLVSRTFYVVSMKGRATVLS